MNWNPYKRIAELEKARAADVNSIGKLTDFSILLRSRIEALERTQNLHEFNLKDLNNRVQRSEGIAVEQDNKLHALSVNVVKPKDLSELVGGLAELKRNVSSQARWLASMENRLKETHPDPVATMTMGDFKKAKIREYARARYARIKAEKLAGDVK